MKGTFNSYDEGVAFAGGWLGHDKAFAGGWLGHDKAFAGGWLGHDKAFMVVKLDAFIHDTGFTWVQV